jgi:hypothetical protein
MMDVAYCAVALVAAAAMGAWVLRVLRATPVDARDALLWMLAVGLGVFGAIGLGLAAAQLLRVSAVAALVALALAGGGREAWRTVVAVIARLRWPSSLAVAPAIALGGMMVAIMAPVVTGDQTKYQLAYPKLYAAAEGLVATPWSFWGQQQFLQNFLFAVAYVVRGERLALLLSAVWLPLAAAAVMRLVDRHLWRGVGRVAAALVVTAPMAWSLATKAGADLALVTYTTLAVTAFLDWRRGGGAGAPRRGAVAAGLAGGTKIMGLLTPGLLGIAMMIVLVGRRQAWRARIVALCTFAALAGVAAVPPYARNLGATGNPVHPFAAGLFPSRHWSPEAGAYLDEYYRQYQTARAARRDGSPYRGVDVLRFPWDATMAPESFERAARQSLNVGPFALAFFPAAMWLAWRRRAAAWVLGMGAAYGTIVAFGVWAHPRYVLPGGVLVLATAVAGARALRGAWFAGVIALTLVGHLAMMGRLARPLLPDQLRLVAGTLTRTQYLERHSERARFWRRACPMVGTAGKVIVLEKIPHPYFIDCSFVLASYLEQALIDYRAVGSVDALAAVARQLGVTHVAASRVDLARQADPYEARVTTLWRDWTTRLGPPALEQSPYVLYALPAGTSEGP